MSRNDIEAFQELWRRIYSPNSSYPGIDLGHLKGVMIDMIGDRFQAVPEHQRFAIASILLDGRCSVESLQVDLAIQFDPNDEDENSFEEMGRVIANLVEAGTLVNNNSVLTLHTDFQTSG